MDHAVRRVCPFCGQVILLNRCSVYATDEQSSTGVERPRRTTARAGARRPGLPGLDDTTDFDDLTDDNPAPSRARSKATPQPSPLWSWTPPRQPEPLRRGRWFSPPPVRPAGELPLKPLTDFPPERLARRHCTNPECNQPLPSDLDERQAHILAVVGLNGAGKTYYLATTLTEAMNGQGLDAAGFREFEPDDETAQHFYTDYYVEVYRDQKMFQPTPQRDTADQRSLNFRARVDGCRPMLVMTHDISGETLVDHKERARRVGFLRRASAMIFLVDPVEFDDVRDQMSDGDLLPARSIHQRDLLSATLRELEFEPGRRKVPVAVVVSKSDLLTPFLPADSRLLDPPAPQPGLSEKEWLGELQQSSVVVRDLLLRLGQQRLVRTAEAYGNVSFHAVSAVGGRPGLNGRTLPRPRRVLDPLALVLWRLSMAVG